MLLGGLACSFVTASFSYSLFVMVGFPSQVVFTCLGYVWGSEKEDSKC